MTDADSSAGGPSRFVRLLFGVDSRCSPPGTSRIWRAESATRTRRTFLDVTPLMHDFWAVDADSRDEELTAFLQNVTLFGAALAFVTGTSEH